MQRLDTDPVKFAEKHGWTVSKTKPPADMKIEMRTAFAETALRFILVSAAQRAQLVLYAYPACEYDSEKGVMVPGRTEYAVGRRQAAKSSEPSPALPWLTPTGIETDVPRPSEVTARPKVSPSGL